VVLITKPTGGSLKRSLGMAGCSLCKARHLITIGIISFLEEIVQMAFNQRNFRKDNSKAVKLRTVCGVKILKIFEKEVR